MNRWRETPTLAGRHVTLRPFDPADIAALTDVARTDDLWDLFYANVSQLKTPTAGWRPRWPNRIMVVRFCSPSSTRRVWSRGATRFMRMNETHRRLEIGGTFYATRVQRTGVNTEAKRLLLTHAFDVLGCQCVQIRTDALNKRSQTAIERLGAKQDGILRGQSGDGEWPPSRYRRVLDHRPRMAGGATESRLSAGKVRPMTVTDFTVRDAKGGEVALADYAGRYC